MRSIRRALLGALVAGVVVMGLVAQAGAYLLDFTSPDARRGQTAYDGLSHAQPGRHPVGIRRIASDEAPVAMTVWYPARKAASEGPAATYSYAVNMLSTDSTTALATFTGRAHLEATPDVARGPYPLVVLSSGFGITSESYAWLAEHLASQGLVVVAPAHDETLDPRTLWRSTVDRPDVIGVTRSYVESAAGPSGDLAGLVDNERVAVVGHSYGGYTALASGGARIDSGAFTTGCASARADDPIVFLCDALLPRLDDIASSTQHGEAGHRAAGAPVDAVVSLAGDAAMFGEPGLAAVTAPVMVIGGTADHDSPFDWSTRLAYESVSSKRKVEVALDGAEHFVFSGQCDSVRRLFTLIDPGFCSDPAWDRARARAVVRHYVAAFLLSELAASPTAQAELSPHRQPEPGVGYRAVGY